MGKLKTVPFSITAAAGEDKKHSIYTNEFAKIRTKEIEIITESGTRDVLFISLYYGDMKMSPVTGEWTSDGVKLVDKPDVVYYRGDSVLLRVRNTDTANPHFVYGSLEFEVEEE